MTPLPAYAELHCRSNFSFLSGASHPEELVARAAQLGYAALALTDEGSLAGVVRAHAEARRVGLHLIVGAQLQLTQPADKGRTPAEPGPRLVLLAQSRRGYGNLAQWITVARRRAPKGEYLAHPSDVEGRVPHAPYLAGLPGCIALLLPDAAQPFETVFAHAMWLKTWFGAQRAFIAAELLLRAHDAELADTVQRAAQATGLAVVAAGAVRMHLRSRKPLLDVLAATKLRRPVADCGFALEPNAEAHLRSRQRLASIYPAAWLEATLRIAGQCAFSLDELRYEYPQEIVPDDHTPASWLRALTERGVARRFPAGMPAEHRATLEAELALIESLKYEPYFLTVADIVHWARARGILCQGRGSAANSLVCYCLGVTEVDPRRATLLFGRFISAERNEPPDIDIDFEHQRREEVIQYLYRKYGRHRAALAAVVISYRSRSALRDVGRALGLDAQRVDAVAAAVHRWVGGRGAASAAGAAAGAGPAAVAAGAGAAGGEPDAARGGRYLEPLREHGFDPAAPVCRQWVELAETLIGFPRHLSQHPGGFVIARDDLARLVPVENAAMPGRSVIQWDKDDLDALGLIKVDILALGMLSALRRALRLVGAKLGRPAQAPFTLADIPDGDAPTFDMICAADTVGVFQIESRAQMSMLPRLQPRCWYDLVIEVAIVRPGPLQGGMVHPYLRNRALPDDAIDCPAELKPALARTKGVPIFQEQVMQVAMLAADFSAGEADQLRRAMAAWRRKGGLGPFHDRLVGRMVEKGYARAYAEAVFKQIEGFGEYGFPESHAASFALLVYASAWLKRHHPDAFLVALLNSQPMGFYAPAQLVRDARAHGVAVLPADVGCSAVEATLEPPAESGAPWPVRLGLNQVGGLGADAAQRIVAARAAGPFAGVEDLARRAALDAGALARLARADALASIAGHRRAAVWAAAGVDARAPPLLARTRTHEPAAALAAPDAAEELFADYRATGLSLRGHPLALLRAQLAALRVQPAAVLRGFRSGQLARASGLVTHRQRPATAKGVVFVTLEDETGSVNVIVWPDVAAAQRRPLLASRLLTVYGVWQREGEGERAVMHLIARRLVDQTALLQGLASRSRDFR